VVWGFQDDFLSAIHMLFPRSEANIKQSQSKNKKSRLLARLAGAEPVRRRQIKAGRIKGNALSASSSREGPDTQFAFAALRKEIFAP